LIKRMKAFEPFVANKSRPHRAKAAKKAAKFA
jgi:hypothetical protein